MRSAVNRWMTGSPQPKQKSPQPILVSASTKGLLVGLLGSRQRLQLFCASTLGRPGLQRCHGGPGRRVSAEHDDARPSFLVG